MAYVIGALVGGIVITGIISRLLRATLFRSQPPARGAVGAFLATLAVATLLGAFGFADGGAPDYLRALGTYVVPTLFWLAFDLVRVSREGRRETRSPAP